MHRADRWPGRVDPREIVTENRGRKRANRGYEIGACARVIVEDSKTESHLLCPSFVFWSDMMGKLIDAV